MHNDLRNFKMCEKCVLELRKLGRKKCEGGACQLLENTVPAFIKDL
jgi:hypothetical protein